LDLIKWNFFYQEQKSGNQYLTLSKSLPNNFSKILGGRIAYLNKHGGIGNLPGMQNG
jgi:hypothetical protein